jgi:hypothetical protein
MRCKTSIQGRSWYPENASPANDLGIAMVEKGRAEGRGVFPKPYERPPMAEYNIPFKRQEKVQAVILGINARANKELMPDPAHQEWETFFQNVPQSAECIDDSLVWEVAPRADTVNAPVPERPTFFAEQADRSVYDPAEVPAVPSMQHAGFTATQRENLIRHLLSDFNDIEQNPFALGQYCLTRRAADSDVTDYRLPWDLVRVVEVLEDGERAKVLYHQEFGGWEGDFRAWLPAGAAGQRYYHGFIPKGCVVVTNVPRTKGKGIYVAFKLPLTFRNKIKSIPEGEKACCWLKLS